MSDTQPRRETRPAANERGECGYRRVRQDGRMAQAGDDPRVHSPWPFGVQGMTPEVLTRELRTILAGS